MSEIKKYRDKTISKIEESDSEFEYEKFPKDETYEMMRNVSENRSECTLKGVLDQTTEGSQAQSEIDHFKEAKIYSKSHELPESAKVQGSKSSQ
jgi:hypothetical protein